MLLDLFLKLLFNFMRFEILMVINIKIGLLGYDAVWFGRWILTFQSNLLSPSAYL